MGLYPFQRRVCDLLSEGRSVILQAPTGSGKTRAALYPFLRAWECEGTGRPGEDFPRKCIYSVPLRVLANQFWTEYASRATNFGFRRPMDVTIQTGARAEDPKLEGNLVFATIDQTLSNLLNIPYALSLGQGNLNAGAVVSSYLVFDELHLFDPDTTLPATLHLLRLLRGVVPFLVMTATLSTDMVGALAKELDAEAIVLDPAEAAAIPSQKKTRRVQTVDAELHANQVLERHERRSLAICNTVPRAQALFQALQARVGENTQVRLLHSRFLREDRDACEEWLQREFGKEKERYTVESAILVATQVVEVGLDITCQALHTELAPAASVVQRAGRCARYQDEEGDVYVYHLPVNEQGQAQYAPYLARVDKDVCDRTWPALAGRSGQALDFRAELEVVDAAHRDADRRLLDGLRSNHFYIADRIAQTMEAQERGAARELIRAVDSRTVIVHPEPNTVDMPWAYEGFGLHRGSLFGAYEGVEALADELGEDWVMMTADARPEEESSRERTVWCWRHIMAKEDLEGCLLVAVNPRLASYSAETGFQLGVAGDGKWQSPLRARQKREEAWAPYERETFQEHVERMLRVYWHAFYDRRRDRERLALSEEMAYAARRLEEKWGWQAGTMDRLARLVVAVHDLGKLDTRWQAWAHAWQHKVGALRGEDVSIAGDYLAAHTDYDEENEGEKALNRQMRGKRPNHAAESAAAAMEWLLDQTGNQALARAALTAVVRHHSAAASGRHGVFHAHAAATDAVREALALAGLEDVDPAGIQQTMQAGDLSRRLIRFKREEELLPYLLLARALRLADQRSQLTMS
ncbi:MAG: CRISPR-associated helicase Cas3' [Anaerolineae bacterium]|nr:CRISPR-associated helicase Cas3' [Anaerolineae bacterium]